MKQKDESYLGHAAGKKQRDLLAELLESNTLALTKIVHTMTGATGLHMNCGDGRFTTKLAGLVGPNGSMTGIDQNTLDVITAKEKYNASASTNLFFYEKSEFDNTNDKKFDFAYCRYLFSQSANPLAELQYIHSRLKKNGIVLLEDVDLTKLNCFPYSYAFDQFKELLLKISPYSSVKKSLYHIIHENMNQGPFQNTQVKFLSPSFLKGKTRRLASLTFESVMDDLIKQNEVPHSELFALLTEIKSYEAQPHTMISIPGTFQIWGYRMS